MKSACVFHTIRAKSNYKKSRRRTRNKHSGPTGLAISDAALGRQIVQDLKRSRTGRLPFFLSNRPNDDAAINFPLPLSGFNLETAGDRVPIDERFTGWVLFDLPLVTHWVRTPQDGSHRSGGAGRRCALLCIPIKPSQAIAGTIRQSPKPFAMGLERP